MVQQTYVTLNNGVAMPLLGLGVYDMYNIEAEEAVLDALNIGYRLIDTANLYKNEKEIGNAVRKSGIKREEIFVTTKLGNPDQGYESTLKAFDESMKKLAIDYIDLYLIHWPIRGKRRESWLALEKLYQEKQVKAIGVANYLIPFLEEMEQYGSITPALNQVEFSPYLYLQDLENFCKSKTIQLQSYTPLIRGKKFGDKRLQRIASKYNKTPAQIILRWNIQKGISAIPKSSNKERLRENFNLFDFAIDDDDMSILNNLNENFRVVDNPMDYF